MKLNRRQLRRLIKETVQEGYGPSTPAGRTLTLKTGEPAYILPSAQFSLEDAHKAVETDAGGSRTWKEQKQKEGFNSFRFVETSNGTFYLVAEKK